MKLARSKVRRRTLTVAVTAMLAFCASATAQTGGAGAPGSTAPPPASSGTPRLATLQSDGSALAPPDAPRPVRKAINAANRIRTLPYKWGGGHGRWRDTGYDCSGAVSYVLHAAGLLKKTPLDSSGLARWGSPGTGQWVTVYGRKTHAYAVIAGLRWDTSNGGDPVNSGSGPRWRSTPRSPLGYAARYYPSL